MTTCGPGPELDEARRLVVERGLTAEAVGALTETVRNLPLDALAPVKQLLKRFFSDQPWTERDDAALADIVGVGSGSERLDLDRELTLVWGWEEGRFSLHLSAGSDGRAQPNRSGSSIKTGRWEKPGEWETDVVPEVTPSPRTIRFSTPPLHVGPSQFYNSLAEAAADPRAARIFREFDAVTNILVGPEFVAVTISRPDRWETLLGPMLHAIAEEFTRAATDGPDARSEASESTSAGDGTSAEPVRSPRRLERAWADLGALRADRPDELERILSASRDAEPAYRQVAAALLSDAPPADAAQGWEHLYGDSSRAVRRSVVDAVVDAEREELRPLLERALSDPDAWIRWKAVHGIAALGTAPSRAAVEARAADPDFRVRLEAARALA